MIYLCLDLPNHILCWYYIDIFAFSVSNDMPFGRQLQSMAQTKQGHQMPPGQGNNNNGGNKEPSLMPVPSPQQIQYMNTFDGHELTIQKQPNTSLRESDILSP